MERVDALAAEIRKYCKENANPKGAERYARYFREGYDAWGLIGDRNHPIWNEKQREWAERYQDLGLAGFLRVGERLFAGGKYEEGALGIRFLSEYRHQLNSRNLVGIARWFPSGIQNWAHTDVLCGEILQPLLTSGRVPLKTFGPWRESEHKYQRRAVPVAMLSLVREGCDIGPLLEFVRPLMLDPERAVQQGVGWFLREAWKKDPKAVEAFLLAWKNDAPRLIFQYATEKMTSAEKQRFRRKK